MSPLTEMPDQNFTLHPVADLVPHTPPMVLLDRIVGYTGCTLDAAVTIQESSRFFDAALQGEPAWASIEYMAQSISALAGIKRKQQGLPVQLGFLLGSRKFEIFAPVLKLHCTYRISVRELFRSEHGMASFQCDVYNTESDTITASARINVMEASTLEDAAKHRN